MAANKTQPTDADVDAFLADAPRGDDARQLAMMMAAASGEAPFMYGSSIVGFGRYHYKYDSGREGDMCRIGFAPRKGALVLYLGESDERADLLARLGKHTTGKACVYVKKLADVDTAVLGDLLAATWRSSLARHPG